MRKVIIIYGMPGSGKGTQANLLADKFGMYHFDTGKYLEQIVHNPDNKNNKKIQKHRKDFDNGILLSPPWVLKIVRENAIKLANAGFGIVFSGSPRTVFEAFGDKNYESLIKTLEKKYNKKNIIFLYLKVSPETSIKRNVARRVCRTCGSVIISKISKSSLCPVCMSKLEKRTLDKPSVIKVRHKEYMERTAPILEGLKKMGYKIIEINGEPAPAEVFKSIVKKLGIK
ncbi:AAA family ATPase [Candidatus Wolfebacteria bacterium]|nr:AAA family ATPase [Candidatus Wolfebacteria bacterium]